MCVSETPIHGRRSKNLCIMEEVDGCTPPPPHSSCLADQIAHVATPVAPVQLFVCKTERRLLQLLRDVKMPHIEQTYSQYDMEIHIGGCPFIVIELKSSLGDFASSYWAGHKKNAEQGPGSFVKRGLSQELRSQLWEGGPYRILILLHYPRRVYDAHETVFRYPQRAVSKTTLDVQLMQSFCNSGRAPWLLDTIEDVPPLLFSFMRVAERHSKRFLQYLREHDNDPAYYAISLQQLPTDEAHLAERIVATHIPHRTQPHDLCSSDTVYLDMLMTMMPLSQATVVKERFPTMGTLIREGTVAELADLFVPYKNAQAPTCCVATPTTTTPLGVVVAGSMSKRVGRRLGQKRAQFIYDAIIAPDRDGTRFKRDALLPTRHKSPVAKAPSDEGDAELTEDEAPPRRTLLHDDDDSNTPQERKVEEEDDITCELTRESTRKHPGASPHKTTRKYRRLSMEGEEAEA